MLIPVLILVLLILGLVCFLIAAWRPEPAPLFSRLVTAGLTAWILADVIRQAVSLGR